jgi:hypothetical protein
MAIKLTGANGWNAVKVVADTLEELESAEQHVKEGEFGIVQLDSTTAELYVKVDKNAFLKIQ